MRSIACTARGVTLKAICAKLRAGHSPPLSLAGRRAPDLTSTYDLGLGLMLDLQLESGTSKNSQKSYYRLPQLPLIHIH